MMALQNGCGFSTRQISDFLCEISPIKWICRPLIWWVQNQTGRCSSAERSTALRVLQSNLKTTLEQVWRNGSQSFNFFKLPALEQQARTFDGETLEALENQRERQEASYAVWKRISYILYIFGWGLGLAGKALPHARERERS